MTDDQMDLLIAQHAQDPAPLSAARYFVGLGNMPDVTGRAQHVPLLTHTSCSHVFVDAHEAGQFLQLVLGRTSLPQAVSAVRTAGYMPTTSVGLTNSGGFAHLLRPRDLWAVVFYPAPHLETSRYGSGRRRWHAGKPQSAHPALPVLMTGNYRDRDVKAGAPKTTELQLPYLDGRQIAEHLFLSAALAGSVG